MKHLSVILFFLSSTLSAQILDRDSLAGTWICLEAKMLPSEELKDPDLKASLETMAKALTNASFKFGTDGLFTLTLSKTNLDLSQMYTFINGQKWYLNADNKRVSIGPPKENIMSIEILPTDDQVFFYVTDLPLALKMDKK